MIKRLVSALLFTCLVVPTSALAEGLRYTYIEGGYVHVDLDNSNVDGDGVEVRGSVAVTDLVHLFGGIADIEFDGGVDLQQLDFGAGVHVPVAPSTDFIAELAYINVDLDGPGSADDDGVGLSAGLRGQVPQTALELEGYVNYVELDNAGDDTSVELEGHFHLNPIFAVGAGVEFGDDATVWSIILRGEFGP